VSREIAKKIGCSSVTVCHWIHRLIACDGVVLPKAHSKKRRRNSLNIKGHRSHSHQYRRRFKLTLQEKEKLRANIVEMYLKSESAPKVAEELCQEGIFLSPPTILRRVRESFSQKIQI
jgi:transposase